jgi:hypothetical protein
VTRDEEVKYALAELYQTMGNALKALMAKVDARARAEEREACAALADDVRFFGIAKLIREREES